MAKKNFVTQFKSALSPWQVFQNLEASAPHCFFLDSAAGGRFSYLGANPFLEVSLRMNQLKVSGRENAAYSSRQLIPVMRKLLKKWKPFSTSYPFWTGGAVGFLGYETAGLFEAVSFCRKKNTAAAEAYFGFYDEVIIFDHLQKKYFLAVHASEAREAAEKTARLKLLFTGVRREHEGFEVSEFKPVLKRAAFERLVRRAKKYIEAGDIYQANLSQRFSFHWKGSAVKLYGALRRINPSPFASYLKMKDFTVISSSPERLVSKFGAVCETRPIAGTRPRRRGLERELLASPKERAEHVMLVDLERNDLGRVCDYKTVKVREMMAIEKYSHVIHIVSKITGKISKGKDGWDLIKAMFPGGTITGCPKVRCMQIIDELEPVRRGLYTGSIGYFDFNGNLDFNIIIRTLVLEKNRGFFQTGAGIVYDSDPSKEYEETLHKGEAMAQAIAEAQL